MYKIIYIISVILLCFSSVVYIIDIKMRSSEKSTAKNYLIKAAFVATGVNALLGIISLFDTLNPEMFGKIFLFSGIISVVETIIYLLYLKLGYKTLRFAAKSFFVASVLELTVFNYPSFYLWNSEFKEQSIDISQAYVQSDTSNYISEENAVEAWGPGEFTFSIQNFNGRIGSIYADLEFDKNTKKILFKIDAGDEAQNATLRYDYIARYMIHGRETSQTIQTLFSGDVGTINLKFTLENAGDGVRLKGITFNKPIKFTVSILRLIVTLLLPVFVYAIYSAVRMNRSYEKNKKFCNWAAAILTALFCAAAIGTINYRLEKPWSEEMKQLSGNQITQELVDAFSNGQVNLLAEPSPELMALENPYDRTARDTIGGRFEWDHLLYDGAYFSYYGIAPVVLLFWPYHAITGYYFSTPFAILLFSVLGMVGLTLTYMTFIRKWFGKISSGMVIAGLIMMQIVSGIWFSIGRTDIYEIAESSGFAFLTWGAWLLLSSNIVGKGQISYVKTAFSSLLLGISVMCRPTLAVYCICAVIFMIYALPKAGVKYKINDSTNSVKKERYFIYILCAAVPMLIIAIIQMWYNNVRFTSPFNFGIQYSLTINDFTHAQYHTKLSLVPIYNYLFAAPSFKMGYPFVHTEYQSLDIEGFLYADLVTSNTSGLFFLVLPMFMYFFAGRAFKKLTDRKSRVSSLLYISLPCVIMPLIIMAAVWESGYSVRYMVDFAWEMTIGAFAIFFYLYLNTKNETIKSLLKKFFIFSMVWTIVIGGFQIANQMFNNGYNIYPEIQYSIEQAFAFWK